MTHKEQFSYKCGYCGTEFNRKVGSTGGGIDPMGGVSDKVSDAVTCPQCGNFIKTFEEVKK